MTQMGLNTLENTFSLKPEETYIINYIIAGSYTSEQEAYATYDDIKNNMNSYLHAKRERYEELANRSKLTVPDKDMLLPY